MLLSLTDRGETSSTLISDLAVGIGAKYIKTGAPARGERNYKIQPTSTN